MFIFLSNFAGNNALNELKQKHQQKTARMGGFVLNIKSYFL